MGPDMSVNAIQGKKKLRVLPGCEGETTPKIPSTGEKKGLEDAIPSKHSALRVHLERILRGDQKGIKEQVGVMRKQKLDSTLVHFGLTKGDRERILEQSVELRQKQHH